MTCPEPTDSPVAFTRLPLWLGLGAKPGGIETLAFSLGCTPGGWIQQTTAPEVLERVFAAYAADDYGFITPPPGASAWANSLGERNVEAVLGLCGAKRPHTILEVGGGSLYVARRLSETLAPDHYTLVDPALRGDETGAVEVIGEYFPNTALAGRRFDLIVSFNCMEHVPDPQAFLAAIKAHLAPDGIAIVIAPDIEAQFRAGDLNAILHEHISYLTVPALTRMAATVGLGCSATSRADQFVARFHHDDDAVAVPGDDSALLALASRQFHHMINDVGTKVRAALDRHGRVAFHGATNGLNTFLSLTGLAGDSRVHVYDGDDSKTGKYLPACVNGIRSAKDDPAYVSEPEIWVSALTFFAPIVEAAIRRQVPKERLRALQVTP